MEDFGPRGCECGVTGVGKTDDALMHSLSGKIDANVKQGALYGVDIPYELPEATAC